MRKLLLTIAAVLGIAGASFGQGLRYQSQITTSGLPSPTVRVCTEPATGSPCSPLATIFQDKALSQPLINPFTGDVLGNYFFYGSGANTYHVQIFQNGALIFEQADVSMPGSGGGGGGTGSLIQINSAAIPAPTGNFNSLLPAAPANSLNVNFQNNNNGVVTSISANVPYASGAAPGVIQLAGDLGNTAVSPQVTSTHLAAALPLAQGGTGQVTASAAFNALAPSTVAGGLIVGTGTNTYGNLPIGLANTCFTSNGTTALWGSCSPGIGAATVNQLAFYNTTSTLAGNTRLTENAGTLAYTGTNLNIGGVGTGTGILGLKGNTSGLVNITVASVAGNWNFQLPANPGLIGQILQTDGTGITSWANPGGGGSGTVGNGVVNQIPIYNGTNGIVGDAKLTDVANVLTYSGTTLSLNTGTTTASTITAGDGFAMVIGGSASNSIVAGIASGTGKSFTIASHDGDATHFGGDLILRAGSSTNPGALSLSPGWVNILAGNTSGSAAGSIALVQGTDAAGAPGWVQFGCVGGFVAPCPVPMSPTTAKLRLVGKTAGFIDLTVVDNISTYTFKLPGIPGLNGQVLTTDGTGTTSWTTATGGGTLSGSGTNNTIAKWTGASTLANSGITDNGSTVSTAENLATATTTAATNVSNVNSPFLQVAGNYWTGAVSAADTFSLQNVAGAGTNPTETLTLTHSGSSGAASFLTTIPFSLGGLTLTAGTLDAHLVTLAIPWITGTGVPVGGTCITNGQVYFRTDGTPGQQLYFCNGAGVWTLQLNSGSGGANVALSNLAGVAINTTLLPSVGNLGLAAADLGSNALPFNTLFLGSAATNNLQIKGTGMTAARNVTFPDNSGQVAELNFANTWTASQAFSSGFTFTTATSTSANVSGTGTFRLGPTDAARYGCVSCNSGLTTTGLTDMNLIRGNGSSGPALVGDYLGINVAGPIGTFAAGGALTIQPSAAASGNTGGDLTLSGGGTSGVGNNGSLHLKAGSGGSGTPGFIDVGSSGMGVVITNDIATGTVVNNLVSLNASGNAVQSTAGVTSGVIGIAGAGAGTAGSATVVQFGRVNCVFDGTAIPGHYVGISLSSNGLCTDAGVSPASTSETIGTVIANVAGVTYSVLVNIGAAPGSSSATNIITNPGSTQQIQATAPGAVGLAIKQPNGGSVDIFQVLLANGTKAFSVNSTGQAVFGTGTSSVTSSAFISSASNPAGIGLVRAASSDDGLCFRNNANTNDVCLSKNTSDTFTLNNSSGFAITPAGSSFATTLAVAAPAANRTINLGDPGGNDSIAYLAAAQTFTNKLFGDQVDFGRIATPANPPAGAGGECRLYYDTGTARLKAVNDGGSDCGFAGAGGAPALNAITAASASNTINNGNNPQRWNFSLTTNSTIAMRFSENVASIATSSSLVQIDTIAASTLFPLTVTALGTSNGLRVNNIGDLTFLGTGVLDTGTASAVGAECVNEGVTGTTNGSVAKLNTSNQCIKATVSDVAGVEGIVIKGGATTGNAVIATGGVVSCTFSNATTVNDYVGVSTTTAGNCLDLGSQPTAGAQVLGKVLTAGLAATSQSVAVYGRGMLAIAGTASQVNTAFAGGVLTLSLPQSIATGSTVTFGAVKAGQLVTSTTAGALTVQVADTNSATSVTGLITVRGGDQSGTANGNAGNLLVRGGSSASTGTGAAGNADLRAGQATAAGNLNGHVQVQGSYIKGVTYTNANLQCFTADNTVQDCATSSTNFVGVAVASNGNAATVAIKGTQVLVNYDATVTPSAGWFACSSATVAGKATAQAGACAAGRTVGIVEAGGVNVTSGDITLAHF